MHAFRNSIFADEDLIEAFIYGLTVWGEEQALKYKESLEKGRERICEDPYLLGSKSQEQLAEGCRSYKVNHYYFFYRFNTENSSVDIARILRENRDFPRHVTSETFPE